jgi:hypothetical protein
LKTAIIIPVVEKSLQMGLDEMEDEEEECLDEQFTTIGNHHSEEQEENISCASAVLLPPPPTLQNYSLLTVMIGMTLFLSQMLIGRYLSLTSHTSDHKDFIVNNFYN